jgi:hypothetical protein
VLAGQENLIPACNRLLQTEILPQNESRRRAGESCLRSSDKPGSRPIRKIGHLKGVGHSLFVTKVWQANKHTADFVGLFAGGVQRISGVGVSLDPAEFESLSPSWMALMANCAKRLARSVRASVTRWSGKNHDFRR